MGLTTDRDDPGLKNIGSDGQQEVYLILSAEERAKGFVRPVRDSYIHVGLEAPKNELRDLTEGEHEQYDKFRYVKYEKYPPSDSCVVGRYWTQDQLDKIDAGCKTLTRMGLAIAETYARNPTYYGATFCCGCNRHLPVTEFVWDGTNERVGS